MTWTVGATVTCSPGAATFTGAQSPISVSLPIGRYTFTVKAVNFGGESEASAPSGVCEVTGELSLLTSARVCVAAASPVFVAPRWARRIPPQKESKEEVAMCKQSYVLGEVWPKTWKPGQDNVFLDVGKPAERANRRSCEP